MPQGLTLAYGKVAFIVGIPISENPYWTASLRWWLWRRGWKLESGESTILYRKSTEEDNQDW